MKRRIPALVLLALIVLGIIAAAGYFSKSVDNALTACTDKRELTGECAK